MTSAPEDYLIQREKLAGADLALRVPTAQGIAINCRSTFSLHSFQIAYNHRSTPRPGLTLSDTQYSMTENPASVRAVRVNSSFMSLNRRWSRIRSASPSLNEQ